MRVTKFELLGEFYVFKHRGRIAIIDDNSLDILIHSTSGADTLQIYVQVKDRYGNTTSKDEIAYIEDLVVCSIKEAADFLREKEESFIEIEVQ